MKETRRASTTAIALILKIKEHLSQIGCDILLARILIIGWWLWPKVRGKFAATQVRHIVALTPLDAPLELVSILGFILLYAGAYRHIGGDAIRHIAQAQCVTLRAVLIGVIAILAFKTTLC